MHEAAHKLARLCSFSMLSGRLWSHDHQAAPTAAMNHYLTEPPLDRRREREREREGGPATGRKGWRGVGVRCGGNYTLGQRTIETRRVTKIEKKKKTKGTKKGFRRGNRRLSVATMKQDGL